MTLADEVRAIQPNEPSDAPTPGVRWEGGEQTLTSRPTEDSDANWDDELRYWGLDPAKWVVVGIPRLSVWEQNSKANGTIQLRAWKANIVPIGSLTSGGPAPIVSQATPVDISPPARPDELDIDGWSTAVILPDAQRPTQDPLAVDVSFQILEAVEHTYGVDDIIHLGDDLDLPDFGRHRSAPDVMGKLNLAIDQQYRALAYERAMCPDARMVWIEGNHEARLTNWLVDNAPQLLGLQRADSDNPDPVLSIPYLCRLDELDVEYLAPYPEGELWLNDNLLAMHSDTALTAPGATAAKHLSRRHACAVFGHIHRAELVGITLDTRQGPRTFMAGSPGTLCDIGGAVPSAKSGITAHGKQGKRKTENWQQGLWVIRYQPDGEQWVVIEPVMIWAGWGVWRGQTFLARTDVA